MGKLRDAMLRDLLLRELAPSTIDAYLRGAREWVAHYMRPPDELTREDVCAYLDHLRKRGLSPSSRAVYLSGIRFLYAVTLERPEVVAFLRRPKVPLKKVRVLKGRQIRQLMDALPLIQHRALFAVSYGCGLRVSEACQLRIEDIDSERERILVRQAKGGKDRYVPLGPTVLKELRKYYVDRRPAGPYLFPGRGRRGSDTPIVTRTFYRALTAVSDRLGFEPRVTPHHLRHTYACHQLDLGVEVGVLQHLLGHADPRSTAHDITLSKGAMKRLPSPLEVLGTARGKRLG